MKRPVTWLLATVIAVLLCSGARAAVQPSVERYLQSGTTVEAYNLDGSGNLRLGAAGTPVLSTATVVGSFAPNLYTIAQINTLVPAAVGELVVCSDCIRSTICVSSATSLGSWVIIAATGVFTGASFSGLTHCQ